MRTAILHIVSLAHVALTAGSGSLEVRRETRLMRLARRPPPDPAAERARDLVLERSLIRQ